MVKQLKVYLVWTKYVIYICINIVGCMSFFDQILCFCFTRLNAITVDCRTLEYRKKCSFLNKNINDTQL